MGYEFEWDADKTAANLRKHGVSFEEATTAFADPLAINMPDPDHSETEARYVVLGQSTQGRLIVVCYTERPPRTRLITARRPPGANDPSMKKARARAAEQASVDEDTMRPEYDFSRGVRGVTAQRYAQGVNVVLLDPDVAEVFPTARAVNEALRTLVRLQRRRPKGQRSA